VRRTIHNRCKEKKRTERKKRWKVGVEDNVHLKQEEEEGKEKTVKVYCRKLVLIGARKRGERKEEKTKG
jgi:hypothetical protein